MAVSPAIILHTTILLFCIIIGAIIFPAAYCLTEAEALVSLKNSFSNAQALNSWVGNSQPCTKGVQWEGVVCYSGLVTGLRLGGMGLLGEIDVDALLELKALRTISLVNNSFSGSIPQLNRIGFLKAMYLSGNKFSGNIPLDYFQRMRSLKKVWLSNNEFTGQIPSSLAEVPQLVELHLENNQFSGSIPNLENPSLADLNLSNNKLEGEVPERLLKFNGSSFEGNSGLCGEKFGRTCANTMAARTIPVDDAQNNSEAMRNGETNRSSNKRMRIAWIVVVSSVVLVSLVVLLIVRSRRQKKDEDFDRIRKDNSITEEAVEVQVAAQVKREVETMRKVSSSRRGSGHGGGSKGVGELVVVNDEKGIFGLTDLMKAAAEVLGNGALGSSYKAVMSNGVAVVVKRTREMNAIGKEGFDAEMKKIGKLKHWNILTPLAYHYRKDEKLLISEYVPRGSLLYLLHGDRGPSHAELNWHARLKIIRGIAEGMRYLHTELASSNVPHGNLKSNNVLLGPDYEPLLVDYGFNHLVNPSTTAQALFAYKAPEAAQGQVSRACDVYCLGVVILEILTGKFPSQYLSNGKGGTDVVEWVTSAVSEGRESELLDPAIAVSKNSIREMVKLLHIGVACTESNPQQRIDMVEAVRRIEEIKTEDGQESRTVEVIPSVGDGYAESHVVQNQGQEEQSRRRHGSDSFGSQEYFEFGIS